MPEHEPPAERPADQNPERPTNRLAMVALLLGLLGVLLTVGGCLCPFTWAFTPVGWAVAPVAGVLAMMFGFIARGQLKFDHSAAGSRMATAGVTLGGITIALSLLMLLGAYLGWGLHESQPPASPGPDQTNEPV